MKGGKGILGVLFCLLYNTSDCLDFYDGYLGNIYDYCSSYVVCGIGKVPDLITLNGLFRVCVDGHPTSL